MASLKKYNLSGQSVGVVEIDDQLLQVNANSQMVKDYLVAIRNNARQWSAHTKNRAEVNHSGQKPHPQKGTGRARQGYLGAPQYKGGGRVGTPRAKTDQHVSINRKEKRRAIRSLLAEKVSADRVVVLADTELKEPKTKKIFDFIHALDCQKKSILFVAGSGDAQDKNFVKSVRNLPNVSYIILNNASGFDIAKAQHLVVLGSAFDALLKMMKG